MGKRKFTLTARKNQERKKYQRRLKVASKTVDWLNNPEVTELVVRVPLSTYLHCTTPSFHVLCNRIKDSHIADRNGWTCTGNSNNIIKKSFSNFNVTVTILPDYSFVIDIGDNRLDNTSFFPMTTINSLELLTKLLGVFDSSCICIGNRDEKFDPARKRRNGKFIDQTGATIIAYYDNRHIPLPTIRHCDCPILIPKDKKRCRPCEDYRPSLHSLATREMKRSLSSTLPVSTVNYRYLTSPEKRMRLLLTKKETRALRVRLKRLELKLSQKIEENGVVLDDELTEDMCTVMRDHDNQVREEFEEDSFQYVFWRQQREAIERQGVKKKGIRWHPLIIKWCLYLRHQSGKAYETLRNSGCIALPSQRTLRDYSHAVKCGAGFSSEVDQQLLRAANLSTSPKSHAIVALLIDEMSIKEDLIYDKHTGRMIGFVDLGEVNNHLLQFEQSLNDDDDNVPVLAKSMIAFLVKGLFSNLRFPYVQFPCTSITGEQLFTPFWQAVFHLEKMEFKVLATTFDGAAVNRRFVAIHDTNDNLVYKLKNIYADEDRFIYCFSDPPHLMKTTRNCWYSKKRHLWNQGKNISWSHLESLYEEDRGKGSGLALVPKLKYEHLHLTSFSKMRVDLAVQVLSESVGKAMKLIGKDEFSETSNFILMFDKFFDIFNVSNFSNSYHQRKPFKAPFRKADDFRLSWLEKEFIAYLDKWEESVASRPHYSDADKKQMIISAETLLGIRRSVKSFIELVQFLFSMPEIQEEKQSFLSINLSQDPLENFFGCQRQRGATNDNPTVQDYYTNTQALRVVNSFCRDPVRGNCRGNVSGKNTLSANDLAPIPKRKGYKKLQ